MYSECCGARPHEHYDDICSECGEHTEFYDLEDDEELNINKEE